MYWLSIYLSCRFTADEVEHHFFPIFPSFHKRLNCRFIILSFYRCQIKVKAQKRFTVHEAPAVLTLHLKRFDMSKLIGNKLCKHVAFTPTLNLRPYMTGGSSSQLSQLSANKSTSKSPVVYSLYAVLVHSGYGCTSGHYYCYVKAANGNWYWMNDSNVSMNIHVSL